MADLTDQQKAAIAAGESLAETVATGLNPAVGAAITAIATLSNALLEKGAAFTMDDFNAAVAADDTARVAELAAEDSKKPA